MKKSFLLLMLFLAVSFCFANDNNTSTLNNTDAIEETIATDNETLVASSDVLDDECSVTSSGTATTSDGTVVHLTITVTGPCDASIAQLMRDEIAKLRADIAQL